MPSIIADFFQQQVAKPFKEHPPTPAWAEEVTKKDAEHHRQTLAGQGQTDFDAPHNSLQPADRVLVYCYYYLQMHAASTVHVYDQALRYSGLGLAAHTVFVDFGCGPLTLAIGLAWHHRLRLAQAESPGKLELFYVGVERSGAMIGRAKHFLEHSGLFRGGQTLRFTSSFLPADSLCREIDDLLPSSTPVKTDIVLNMGFFIASPSVTVADLTNGVQAILKKYSSHRVWIVFQNPSGHSSRQKWAGFRDNLPDLRLLSAGEEKVGYTNTTNLNGAWKTELCHEVLVRDPLDATVSVPRPV